MHVNNEFSMSTKFFIVEQNMPSNGQNYIMCYLLRILSSKCASKTRMRWGFYSFHTDIKEDGSYMENAKSSSKWYFASKEH